MSLATILLTLLWILCIVYFIYLAKDVMKHKDEWVKDKMAFNVIVSLIANFFDTLGIGSYAISTTAWKINKAIDDDLIPGTLNVAYGIPIAVEATIFIQKVDVDTLTLVTMIGSSIIGSLIGAKIISNLNLKTLRTVMGVALIVVAVITLCKLNAIGPFGLIGTATGLTGVKLVIGIVGNFILGILMCAGIGLYAPCIAMVLLLGMSTDVAFPIMMGSCAYLCPASGFAFVKEGKYHKAAVIPMIISGCIGVLIAGFIVTSLPLTALTYVVCVVLFVCAVMFLNDAKKM